MNKKDIDTIMDFGSTLFRFNICIIGGFPGVLSSQEERNGFDLITAKCDGSNQNVFHVYVEEEV